MQGAVFATLNRKKSELPSLMECLGGLYVNGYPISWEKLQKNKGKFIRLPTYPWQKKTYWIESEESQHYRLSAPHHPLLSRKVKSPHTTWQVEINSQHFPWLEDHRIDGTLVFPAAAYVEAGLALADAMPCVLENIDFKQVLTIQREKESLLQISLEEDSRQFSVHSLSTEQEWTTHATGKVCTYTLKPSVEKIELSLFQHSNSIEKEHIYRKFEEQGLEYGPSFQGIKKLWKKEKEALAEIHIPKTIDFYHLHPSLLDSALQTLIGTVGNVGEGSIILPCRINQIIFHSAPENNIYCYAKCTKQTNEKIVGDLFLCDLAGHVCAQIKGLECRVLTRKNSNQNVDQFFYQPTWEEKPLKNPYELKEKQQWLIGLFGESHPTQILENKKNIVSTIYCPEKCESLDYAQQLVERFAEEENLHILLGYGEDFKDILEIKAVNACVNLVKAIDEKRSLKQTNLWIVTRGTQSVNGQSVLAGSSLWGLCRVIRQEYPHLRCRLLDLDTWKPLYLEAMDNNGEDEIAWRKDKRYVHKLKKKQIYAPKETLPLSAVDQAFSLHLKTPGVIENLTYEQVEMSPPGKGEVGIKVHSSSLNFKDLMKVLGILDQNALEDTYFGKSFGMECSGTLVSVGPRVKHHKIGDKVCCFVPNTFQSYINLPVDHIYQIPPHVNLEEAPIYIPFITVLRALKDIAKLTKGETLLIHSATGAIGLAAIQYAQFVGAKIIATAGNEEKRNYLRQMGVQECADSRSLSFVEDVKKWTDERGVDVILNSLSNDALTKSWSLLAPYGRFIEIGKRDISSNSSLPMCHFNRNTLFSAIDLDRTFIDQPKLIKNLLREANKLFKKGIFKPLPCKTFPANQAIDAFQFMARSKHIGKIMLKFEGETVQGSPIKKPLVHSACSYLITGGFSGFGLTAATWLAKKGAKHLILIGRSGASSEEAQNTLKQLKEQGVHSVEAAIDITNSEQLSRLLKECDKKMPPLKGIIHSAMVLSDALISQLTPASMERVLSPKIGGCLNLHQCTLHCPLDFFVLFSSVSSLIGNPGQGNYAAANAFLDTFCHYRKSLGLPALTMNWGALKIGVLARDKKLQIISTTMELKEYALKSVENSRAIYS